MKKQKSYTPAPKPKPTPPPAKRFSSIARPSYEEVKQLASGAPPRKRPKRANPKRKASEFARCFHSLERVQFVKDMPCTVRHSGGCGGQIDNAHRKGDGASRRSGYENILPLCTMHHTAGNDSLHVLQPQRFEQRHSVALIDACARVQMAWQEVAGAE